MSDPRQKLDAARSLVCRLRDLRDLLEKETSRPRPASVGLLGLLAGEEGETDPLGSTGLGLGASRRARELVIKGLIFETSEEVKRLLSELKKGPGRPRTEISVDLRRAAVVQSLKDGIGRECSTLTSLIDLAIQVEQILLLAGEVAEDDRIFNSTMTSTERLLSSVSIGLREMGSSANDFFRKISTEFSKKDH